MKRLLAIFALLFAVGARAQVTAASCNTSDVQTAINTATEGQTVTIPSGTCTWTSGVTISGKGIKVQGAGSGRIIAYDNGSEVLTVGTGSLTVNLAGFSPGFSSSSISNGETLRVFENNSQTNWMQGTVTSISGLTLVMNITSTGGSGSTHRWLVSTLPSTTIIDNSSSFLWSITEDTSFNTNFAGMQVIAGTDTSSAILLNFNSGGQPVLFHDNWFEVTSNAEMIDSTTNRGVIWNNSFSGSTGNPGQLTTTAGVRIKGAPNSWTSTAAWGTAQGLYIETNDMHAFQSFTDNDDNGIMVFRYNLVDHTEFGTHGADTSNYGERRFEYYNNTGVFYGYTDGSTFNMPNGWVGLVRGGTYVMFGNTLPIVTSQDYGTKPDVEMIAMNLQRNAGPNPCWGAGGSAGQYYHAPRQVGMGNVTGNGTANYPPDGVNNSPTDSITYVGDSEPAYIWGNSRVPLTNVDIADYGLGSSGACPSSPTPDSSANYIVSGRDFFNGTTVKPGYSPYTYPNPLTGGSGPSQAATPTFVPGAGSYTGTQSVTLATTSPGTIICWNTTGSPATNGATGSTTCTAGTKYTAPVSVASSETLFAVAGGGGFLDSPVGSAAYVIRSTAVQPTFSPGAGTYSGVQTVTIASTSPSATICYTANGTTPATNGSTGCNAGTLYTGPVTVSTSQTLKAIAGGSSYIDSSAGSAAYTITTGAATPTFSPVAGNYTGAQNVTLSTATAGAIMCFTTNGSTPATNGSTGCTTGTLYSSPIAVTVSETLKAVAGGTGHIDSSPGTAAYVIRVAASPPAFSPVAGTYTGTQSVTLATSSSGAIICYTTNGTTPATNSFSACVTGTLYSGPISVAASETIKAVAGGSIYNDSAAGTAAYVIRSTASQPAFSPAGGTYSTAQPVTISTSSSGAIICYNSTGSPATNGTTGCTTGTLYTGPVNVTSSQTIFAVAGGTGFTDSTVASAAYTINPVTQSPTFAPPSGPYVMPISVTVSVPSPNASAALTVCYTVSATCVPGSSGTPYTGCPSAAPCTINVNPAVSEQICAVATASGFSPSPVACSGLYTTSTLATGDGRGVQPQPQYPAAMLTTGCTKVAATQVISASTSVNVDPWNPTISTPGSLGGTGGTSLEPASETDDTTLQAAINAAAAGSCVEVTLGTSGKAGLVEAPWKPVNSSGGAVTVIIDPGVTIFASRNPGDYAGSSCGVLPTSGTGGTSCGAWIAVNSVANIQILGNGLLDGRCWDKFTTSGQGFCSNKVQTLCDTHSGGPWAGVTCPISRANHGIANGPNVMNIEGPCTGNCNDILWGLTIKDSGQFNILEGFGLSGFTVWNLGIVGAAEVSNTDGIDPSYCATNDTIAYSRISTGDNHVAIKANSSKGGGCPTSAISLLNNQTGAGIGITLGFESTASTEPGITNVLSNVLVQQGSNNNTGQQVGHGIHSGSGEGGTISTVTYMNSCVANESEDALLYNMSDSGSYSNVQDINDTLLGSAIVNFQGASGRVNSINLNNVNGTIGSHTYTQTTFNGVNVNFSSGITGTGVTNNITNPGGNTPYPCTSSTYQPIHGDLSFMVGTQANYQSFATPNSTQAIVLQASILPANEINTQEATALTQPVVFLDNGSPLTCSGGGAIGTNGTLAQCAVTAGAGNHTYTAQYSGDSGYPGVTYNFGSVTVQVGSSSVVPVGPIQFQGTVVVE